MRVIWIIISQLTGAGGDGSGVMIPFFRNFNLNKKMIIFLVIVLGSSLAITTFLSIRMQRSDTLRSAKDKVRSFAEVIQVNMVRAMEEGRCEDIAAIVKVLASPKEFMMVRILNKEGRIFESTQKEEKGKILHLPTNLPLEKNVILTRAQNGETIFSSLRPFHNEPKCARCHGEEKEVLGFLSVDLSLTSIGDQLKSFTQRHVLLNLGILLLLSGAMFFFFSRFINRPVLAVARKMSEAEKGNLDVQVPVKAQDELGHLASSFNFMVRSLQEMRKKDVDQQNLLWSMNEDLRQKIQELNILYESCLAINRSLQIEEIFKMTTENVTKSLGFDRVVLIVFDEKGEALVGKWAIGIDEEIVQQVRIPKEDLKGVLYETYQKKEPILVRDTSGYPIIESRGARMCWEALECRQEDCPNFRKNELRCWMMTGTRCDREMKQKTFEEKMRVCGRCLYLNQEIIKRSDIVNLLLFGSHSFISVPLIAREQVLGILLADKLHSEKQEITEGEVKLLMTFISHFSVALENAVLYQRLARKVDWSQKQLQETNEQLRQKVEESDRMKSFNESILQNLYGGIVTYTKEGMITFMNRSGADLLGWEESTVLGRSIHEVLCGPNEDTSIFHIGLRDNGGFSGEMEMKKRGGEKIPVEVFLSHLRDKDGNVIGVTGIFRDITEKKEFEARMHRMDKLASLGQLASGIAHEIKNPLAGIGSAIQVLSSNIQLDDTKKEVVKEILKRIQRLDQTIKSLLSFAKPGQPQLSLIGLNEIIETVIFLVSQQIKKQDIQVKLDLQKDLPEIRIDPQQIQQSILNVILNAVEAMPSGGTLTISTREKVLAGHSKKEKLYVSMVVSDTGTGIPERIMGEIFNPFFTTKRSGTGLGLSITQSIIEQHDGKIDIQSVVGKGTSFTMNLPV